MLNVFYESVVPTEFVSFCYLLTSSIFLTIVHGGRERWRGRGRDGTRQTGRRKAWKKGGREVGREGDRQKGGREEGKQRGREAEKGGREVEREAGRKAKSTYLCLYLCACMYA